jgi:hypothetical protein
VRARKQEHATHKPFISFTSRSSAR